MAAVAHSKGGTTATRTTSAQPEMPAQLLFSANVETTE
jgi:hypothetical protein